MRIMKGLVGYETQPVDRILLHYGLSKEDIQSYENLFISSWKFYKESHILGPRPFADFIF